MNCNKLGRNKCWKSIWQTIYCSCLAHHYQVVDVLSFQKFINFCRYREQPRCSKGRNCWCAKILHSRSSLWRTDKPNFAKIVRMAAISRPATWFIFADDKSNASNNWAKCGFFFYCRLFNRRNVWAATFENGTATSPQKSDKRMKISPTNLHQRLVTRHFKKRTDINFNILTQYIV